MTSEEKKWVEEVRTKYGEGDAVLQAFDPTYRLLCIIERQDGEIEKLKNFCELQMRIGETK